jgi:hypothetical protein
MIFNSAVPVTLDELGFFVKNNCPSTYKGFERGFSAFLQQDTNNK